MRESRYIRFRDLQRSACYFFLFQNGHSSAMGGTAAAPAVGGLGAHAGARSARPSREHTPPAWRRQCARRARTEPTRLSRAT